MTRTAVVIGNVEYDRMPPVDGAEPAAMAMAGAFKAHGWGKVDPHLGASNATMWEAVDDAFEEGTTALVYFAGHALGIGGDLLLPAVNHDPYAPSDRALGIKVQDLFLRALNARLACLVLIVDGSFDHEVGAIRLPPEAHQLEFVLMASGRTGPVGTDEELTYTTALVEGLTTRGGVGRAVDRLGNVTPATLHAHAATAQALAGGKPSPIFRCLLREDLALATVSQLDADEVARMKVLFVDGDRFSRVPVTLDHEICEQESEPPLRSRPRDLSGIEVTQEMRDQDLFKRLRNLGFLEPCAREPDGDAQFPPNKDLFWACIDEDAVRLTPVGEAFLHNA